MYSIQFYYWYRNVDLLFTKFSLVWKKMNRSLCRYCQISMKKAMLWSIILSYLHFRLHHSCLNNVEEITIVLKKKHTWDEHDYITFSNRQLRLKRIIEKNTTEWLNINIWLSSLLYNWNHFIYTCSSQRNQKLICKIIQGIT